MGKFYTVVSLIQRDTTTCTGELVSAFSADLMTLCASNNSTALMQGAAALNKTAFGKSVKACMIAAGVPQQGYVGALTGKFSEQPEDVKTLWLTIHGDCVQRFQAALESAGLFEKKILSEETKAKNKAKRDKTQSDKIDAAILERGLIDPSSIPQLSINAMIDSVLDAIVAGQVDRETILQFAQACADALQSSTIGQAVQVAKHAIADSVAHS